MTDGAGRAPLGGPEPLVDIHAHFYYDGAGRANWRALNDSRLRAGERIGITYHVASILGSWGASSPTYLQSPPDTVTGNDAMLALQRAHAASIRSYVAVNPNDEAGAVAEIDRCVAAGAVGLKLAAARRADDGLLDDVCACARRHGLPVLHHIWQHRRRHWPTQDISDGNDLGLLAARHPTVSFILAHIGGGGDYQHTFAAVRDLENVYLDLSGSGADRGMLDAALEAVGSSRMVWGADLTLETGLAKLWALDLIGLAAHDSPPFDGVTRVASFRRVRFLRSQRPNDDCANDLRKGGGPPGCQRLGRAVPVPTRAASGPGHVAPRHGPRRDREGLGWPSAVCVLPRPVTRIQGLFNVLQPHRARLLPVPAVRPDWPDWCDQVGASADQGAAAIRVYPPQWGLGPDDPRMVELAGACAERHLPLVMTVKFEDVRQRHPIDGAGELQPAAVRVLARARTGANIVVTAASRDFVEEVHWGLTSAERAHVWWDISWLWGPPEDHLEHLVRTIGAERLAYGTMWPLRLTQVARANVALLPDDLRPRVFGGPGETGPPNA